jgi:hypothetical protein
MANEIFCSTDHFRYLDSSRIPSRCASEFDVMNRANVHGTTEKEFENSTVMRDGGSCCSCGVHHSEIGPVLEARSALHGLSLPSRRFCIGNFVLQKLRHLKLSFLELRYDVGKALTPVKLTIFISVPAPYKPTVRQRISLQ